MSLIKKIPFVIQFFFIIFCFSSTSCKNMVPPDPHQPIVYTNGWGNVNYPIRIDLSTQITNEDSTLQVQIQNAITTWNSSIGRNILTLRANFLTAVGNDFRSLDDPGFFFLNGNPIYGFYYDQMVGNLGGWLQNTGKDSDVLATTICIGLGNTIQSAAIRFNRDDYVFMDARSTGTHPAHAQIPIDMESLALHELGHFLGLGHVTGEEDSIMSPSMPAGLLSSTTLNSLRCPSANDVARIRSIYPGGTASTLNCGK
jgi:hypothetical protein